MRCAKDDRRKATEILRIIAVHTEVTYLKMTGDCSLADYVVKAETAVTTL